ncbi:putative DNA gyrase subunit A, chloroplastic/mitochondrial [Dendrobium catenatum]|uniref:Putative DNA gyrase subunit A, chloroplastic/mitochondrial n=1 Tax=Dendrobium catenatum TaxID=906689 RepID=A0A2I0WUS3_9ASPA|nr:putative DNA gyrase subunit A, chloroplastic/mitochondrial [Dendrobium catenatum]
MQNSPPSQDRLWMRKNLSLTRFALASEDSSHSGERLSMLKKLRVLGRKTRGVNSMRLKEGDKVASMNIIPFGMQKDFPRASDIPGSRKLSVEFLST